MQNISGKFLRYFIPFYLLPIFFTLHAQQGWENNYTATAEYYFASKAFAPASQFYGTYNYFPSLSKKHNSAEFYLIATALRKNKAGAEKMLTHFMVDNPTSYLTETAYFDAANFYFNQGRYAYSLKWYSKIGEVNVARAQRPQYNFNKAYSFFAAKRYDKAKPLFEKVTQYPKYQSDANYYLGYIAYQLEDYEEANESFKKLNRQEDDNTIGYFQADMNFKLGRFEEAILLARKSLKGADEKETSELSKIIGESYFNLGDYRSAVPYLLEYKGKRGRWNNTDYYQLGYAHYRTKEYQEAIEQFNQIINGENAIAQNAYYHLADSYLETAQKTAALNAFKRASEMKFDPVIKEDALLNYARLSYELGNSYESPSRVLQRLLDLYPKNDAAKEVEKLLLDSYVNSQNYDAALSLLKKTPSNTYKEARQKVNYMKATSLYKSGRFEQAIEYYAEAIQEESNPLIALTSQYWSAMADYEQEKYEKALTQLLEVAQNPNFSFLQEQTFYHYQLGYLYFQLKNYPQAIRSFQDFLSQPSLAIKYQRDARLRLGDSHFVLSAYWPAMDEYEKVRELNPQKAIYAMFQQAISYGFVERTDQKIDLLKKIITQFPSSNYVDDALYEIARAQTKKEDEPAALLTYQELINAYPKSALRSRALLNSGLVLFNRGENSQAQTQLKQLVTQYPDEALASQALQTIKEIAVEENRVDEFTQWLKQSKIKTLPDLELEKAAFEAIERLLNDGKEKAAKRALKNYLAQYLAGGNRIRASFLLAELEFKSEAWQSCLPLYQTVIEAPSNSYTEQALVRLTQAQIELKQNQQAMPLWLRLERTAEFEENRRYALYNLMQLYYEQKQYAEAITYSEKILVLDQLEEQILWDANYVLAKAATQTKDKLRQIKAFKVLEKAPQPERAVEALYFNALEKHRQLEFSKSNEVIELIAKEYGGYPQWGAKSLLLMSKNFYQLDDAFQATYILESIIENFIQFPDIISEAKADLTNIKEVEAINNASINLETDQNE